MEGGTEPLRNSAAQWSLAGDKQLLGLLQDIHERLVSRCQETNRRLGEMAAALDDAAVDLHNVNNKFMALSNTQFIESRVYEDDVELAAAPDTAKESKLPADAASEIEKMKLGLKVFESMHEPLHILHDTDSESDTEDDEISRMVLKLKDPYAHRPLPFIIGSYAWQNKWHAGLVPEDSDSDSSVRDAKHDSREEFSDSEPESAGNIQTDKLHAPERTVSTASSDMMSEQELPPSSPAVKPSPSDVAAELARRLGGHADKSLEPAAEYAPPNPASKKVYRPEKPAANEPPPLEHSYSDREDYSQEEDDDIFAELNKNKPYAQTNRVQNRVTEDLFGGLGRSDIKEDNGDIFSDFKEPSKPANQKSTLFSDESEPELFAEKPPAKAVVQNVPQEASSAKKPIGGISLFGNKGTESIGAAILKRNQRRSSTDEDTAPEEIPHRQQTNKEKDIFDDLFAKSEKEQRKIEKKVKVETEIAKEVVKEVNKEKKIDLFSDNIFDDIDDIFTSNIPQVPIKEASKNQKSIFDDEDDLFSDVAVVKNTEPQGKSSSNIQKSIFDSDDELFSEKTITTPSEIQKTTTKPVTAAKVSKTTGNIFDNSSDNDIFSDVKEPVGIVNNPVAKLVPEKDLIRNKGNVKIVTKEKRDGNLDSIRTAEEKNLTKAENIEKSGLFDENDDIFKTKNSTNVQNCKSIDTNFLTTEETLKKDIFENLTQNKIDVSNKISAKSMFDDEFQDDLFNDSPVYNSKQVNKPNDPKSLFDNDSEEELFSNKSKEKDNSGIIHTHPKTKAIDDVRNNVFGNTNTSLQNTIKVNEGALSSETENTVFKKGNDNLITNSDSFMSSPIKKDVSNIINEEDIDGLFIKSKNIETVTEINKETDSTVNEGNTDEYEDALVKENSTSQEITEVETNTTSMKIKTIFDEKLEEDLFTNIIKNNERKNVGEMNIKTVIDKISEVQKEDHLITEAESLSSDNTDANILNACQNIIFNDKTDVDTEIPPPLSNDFKNDCFNKSDIFSDVFSEPPEFEKPKEPKKSKNINALFDDDSDDEALFFKKNDPTLDDKPDYSSPAAENRLFGLFHDEPPALDVDFEQKINKTPNLCDVPKDQVDYSNDITKSETNLKRIEETPAMSESPKSENVFLECKAELPVVKRIPDKPSGTENDNIKRVGKLKNMNFNINVNALLPGASPKKLKAVEHVIEPTHTKSEVDVRVKDSNLQEIKPKLVKSISFEGKPDSQVLDNTLSKERVKIQVKRRPSTRRARKEAVRRSAIDFGDDSTDHSSSIDDTSRTDNSDNALKPALDSEHGYSSLTYDSILDIDDLKPDLTPAGSDTFDSPKSEIVPKDSDVKTKTVYILNDEDIFDIEPKSKQALTIVNDEYPAITNTSKLDVNEGLIKTNDSNLEAEITNKNFNDESQTLFTDSKSKHLSIIDDEDDLFKISSTGVNTLGKVYKDSKSENIDNESMFKSEHRDTRDNSDIDKVTHSVNLNETKSPVNVPVEHQTEEHNYNTESIEKRNASIDKPKEVKKSPLFDLSDEENELFNKSAKSVKKSVFDSDSDDDLFNKKGSAVKKESKDVKGASVKVKVDVKASLFGDDDDDLFGVKTKKSNDIPSQPIRSTARDLTSRTTEPAFEDPLSLFGGDED